MNFQQQILFFIILITLFVFHDLIQGYIAERQGDDTARVSGRLTINPLPHLDFFTSFLMPVLFIAMGSSLILGWPKPMPFNPYKFRNTNKGFRSIGLAGLFSYFGIMVVFGLALKMLSFLPVNPVLSFTFLGIVQMSASLFILHLLPLPFFDMFYVLSGLNLGSGWKKYIVWAHNNSLWFSLVFLLFIFQTPIFPLGVNFLTKIFVF